MPETGAGRRGLLCLIKAGRIAEPAVCFTRVYKGRYFYDKIVFKRIGYRGTS